MIIKSFKIDHSKLKPGCYLHDVKKINKMYVTTFDLRFKTPNKGVYLTNQEMHSLEHLIATFYTEQYKEKIYFGPMGCQTGFYLVVAGQKDLQWLLKSLTKLDKFISGSTSIPGNSSKCCGNYRTLNLQAAKTAWKQWYRTKENWGKEYPIEE